MVYHPPAVEWVYKKEGMGTLHSTEAHKGKGMEHDHPRRMELDIMKPHSLLILALLASPGAADTLFVAQDGSEEYTTISDAIAEASSGDTITIYAGTYAETIDPGGLDLTIQAYSGDDVVIDGEATRRCVECDSGETSAMTFSELTFENGYGNDGRRGTTLSKFASL